MLKRDEMADPNSCLNKAADDEPIFVIRAKDPCAIATVIAWTDCRIAGGHNVADDPKLAEAIEWCNKVAEWRRTKS